VVVELVLCVCNDLLNPLSAPKWIEGKLKVVGKNFPGGGVVVELLVLDTGNDIIVILLKM